MSEIFEIQEYAGVSLVSTDDAVKAAVTKANKERKVAWFEVLDQRGRVTDDGSVEFQVKVKIGRKL